MFSRVSSRHAVLFTALLTGAAIAPATSTFAEQAPEGSRTQVRDSEVRAASAAVAETASSSIDASPAAAAVRTAQAPRASAAHNNQPRVSFREAIERAGDRPVPTASTAVDAELECLAKVVLHEAGNQSRAGQLAVAHVVMNRVRSGRFRSTICDTVMQRGQFFNVHAYRPHRDPRWSRSLAVAREVRDEGVSSNVGGALFFRASYARAGFPGRTRVVQIGDHVFYR